MQMIIALFVWERISKRIEDQLTKDFSSLCEWFINNKLSIHFGEQKTESIVSGTTKRLKKFTKSRHSI